MGPKQLDKKWFITDSSKVYFEVETSQESVISQFHAISGFWNFNLLHPEKMSAKAQINVLSEESGNSGEALYEDGLLKLKGVTTVKFSDFGLTNPHLITLQTQEEIKIILQLELSDMEPVPNPAPS
ncbi:hypothetical protein [Paenibacillus sp. GP183]|uniref:hypothetical protein n=1 Tax=Paenibacillus sp. GP183 TaxID=1882751 RepID=UPI0008975927|nr:hypothetical protein [Paenibacillus sp. GP183]SEC02749.1 hypothetical protein SAMN05443246_2717 [Paenibacillus sp. GP183]